jgi:hypothetical protein
MKKEWTMLALVAFLSACGDGVQRIDDPAQPIVDGKAINGTEFMQKYCKGKVGNETCEKVRIATAQKSTKGDMPKGY